MGGAALRQRDSSPALEIPCLNEAEIAAFYRDGFLILRSVFSQGEVLRIAAALDRLARLARSFGETRMYHGTQFVLGPPSGDRITEPTIERIVWVGGAEPILSAYGQDPRLTSVVGQILRSDHLEQIINQAHYKFPGDGVSFSWHQDSAHRRYGGPEWTDVDGRGSFVETITAIDMMATDNGPLLVIPGSNQAGHLPTEPSSRLLAPGHFDPKDAVPVLLAPGDVLLMGPYTIHSSVPNEGSHSRRTFLNGFASPGANRRAYPGVDAGRTVQVPRGPLG